MHGRVLHLLRLLRKYDWAISTQHTVATVVELKTAHICGLEGGHKLGLQSRL